MVYLDYSATTPVSEEVLDTFCKVSQNYIGNPNSIHALGVEAKSLMEEATKQVASLLHVKKEEVIFTSGSSESNNLAIMGLLGKYPSRGRQIISTPLEHDSILSTLSYAETLGYKVSFVALKEEGTVDLEDLKRLLEEDTILVSIGEVNSEVGIHQPIEEIGKLLKEYPRTFFHVDGTQAVGKVPVNLENIDLYSFSAHKFYGLKGIGCLIKKEKVMLEPLIHGGKSQTIYRSGTPPLALIVSLARALRLALALLPEHLSHVQALSSYIKEELETIPGVVLNSPDSAIPHIVNISLFCLPPETAIYLFEEEKVYLSTKTACSVGTSSHVLKALKKDDATATHSLRISLSHLTTKEELDVFLKILKKITDEWNNERREY